eukprot:scaffold16701_cov27-Phaeocystis_antarctica.AAC.1
MMVSGSTQLSSITKPYCARSSSLFSCSTRISLADMNDIQHFGETVPSLSSSTTSPAKNILVIRSHGSSSRSSKCSSCSTAIERPVLPLPIASSAPRSSATSVKLRFASRYASRSASLLAFGSRPSRRV